MIENGRYRLTDECERVADILRRVGDKWSVLVVVLLELGPRRFNDLKRSIPGVSQRMLTLTLRNLEPFHLNRSRILRLRNSFGIPVL